MPRLRILGNTNYGITSREQLVMCPRYYKLSKLARGSEQVLHLRGLGADVGTLFHALAEVYHSGGEPEDAPPLDAWDREVLVEPETHHEAWRIFNWYRANYSREAWGTVLATEQNIDSEDVPGLSRAIGFRGEGGGYERYTCKLDLETRMSFSDVVRINHNEVSHRVDGEWVNAKLPRPGRYVLDFKCYKSEYRFLAEMFGPTNTQLTAYQLAAMHLADDLDEYRGIIALVIIKRREPALRVIYSPPPSEDALAAFKAFQRNYGLAKARVELEGHYVNHGACFNWHKQCRFFNRGCVRY